MFPAQLRIFMKSNGLRVSDVAKLLDVTPRTVKRWLDGEWPIPFSNSAFLMLLPVIFSAVRASPLFFEKLAREEIVKSAILEGLAPESENPEAVEPLEEAPEPPK